jgi:ABC-2 type transport system permease protein
MTWIGYTYSQFLLSQKVFWRDLGFALTGALLPLGLGIAYPLSQHGKHEVAGVDAGVFLLPGFMAFVLFWIIYNVINSAASRREALIYKRLRGTPLPDTSILTGEAISGSVTSLIQVLVLLAVGMVAMNAPAPRNIPLFVIGVVLGALMFAVLAIGVSGALPSAELSTWIVTPIIFLMMMGSGVFLPISSLPSFLRLPAQYLPSTPVVDIIKTAYLGRDFASHPASSAAPRMVDFVGSFHVSSAALGLICAWTGIGFALGQKYFRWDPRRSG